MTDFTNYDFISLQKMLSGQLVETTAPIYSPDDPEKIVAKPIYKTGIGFDTESTTITHKVKDRNGKQKTVVDYCFIYTYQIAVGTEYYAIYRTYKQFETFITVLNSVLKQKCKSEIAGGRPPAKCLIWVANLAHEWSFIKYRIAEKFDIEKCFAKTPRDVLYIDFGNFVFRECLGLFGHSLANVAKNWTVTQKLKGDLDYDLIRTSETPLTEQEKQYCINDVIILTEMHVAVLKAYTQSNGGVILPNTSSGFVRLELKNAIRNSEDVTDERECYNCNTSKKEIKTNLSYLMHDHKRLYTSPFQWDICRNYGYCGGLCGSNIDYVGATLHNIQCVDLTSDYPAQMLHKKFPSGRLTKLPLSEYEKIKKQGRPYFVIGIFKKLYSYTHHATFSKHKALNYKNPAFIKKYGNMKNVIVYNGKIRRGENIVVCVNDVDLSAYSMIYDLEFTPLALYAFTKYDKLPSWLFDCIVDNYADKSRLKIAGLTKTVEYMDKKRNVNTFYGVLSTKPANMFDEFTDDGLFTPSDEWSYSKMVNQSWLNPYIAFWVTSYARKILMMFISQFPELIVQYDTDSLYYITDKPNSELMKKAILNYNARIEKINDNIFCKHPDKKLFMSLGTWDFENMYINFLPLGAKKYIKQDTTDGIQTVIAGLPKTAIPAEIANKNIKKPFTHYNVLKKYIESECTINSVIVKHQFANKFASVYNDDCIVSHETIVDYSGRPAVIEQTCYHAIVPIDFTLALGWDFARQIVRLRENQNEVIK